MRFAEIPALTMPEKRSGQKPNFFSFHSSFFVFYIFQGVAFFLGVFGSFRTLFGQGIKIFYISSPESVPPETICVDVRSSVVISTSAFIVKFFSFKQLKWYLNFGVIAIVIHFLRNFRFSFVVPHVFITLPCTIECICFCKFSTQGQSIGVFFSKIVPNLFQFCAKFIPRLCRVYSNFVNVKP